MIEHNICNFMKSILTSIFVIILISTNTSWSQTDLHIVQINNGDQYLSNSIDGTNILQWNGLSQNLEFRYEGLTSTPIKFFFQEKEIIAFDSNEVVVWDIYNKVPKERYALPIEIRSDLSNYYKSSGSFNDFWLKTELHEDIIYLGISRLIIELPYKARTFTVLKEFENLISALSYSASASYLLIEENWTPKTIHHYNLSTKEINQLAEGASITASINEKGEINIYDYFNNKGEIYSLELKKKKSYTISEYVGSLKPLFLGQSHLLFPFSDSMAYLHNIDENYTSSLGFSNGNGTFSQLNGFFMSVATNQQEVSCQTINQFLSARENFMLEDINRWEISQALKVGDIGETSIKIGMNSYLFSEHITTMAIAKTTKYFGAANGAFGTFTDSGKLLEINKISNTVSSLLIADSVIYIGSLGRIVTFDIHKKDFAQSFRAHDGFVNRLSISPNGRFLLSVSTDRSVFLWDLQEQSMIQRFYFQKTIESCELKNDLSFQLVLSDGEKIEEKNIDLFNRLFSNQLEVKTRLQHSSSIRDMDVAKNGNYLISVDSDGVIKIWMTSQMIPIHTLQIDDGIRRLKFIEQGNTFFAFSGTKIYIIDTKTGELIRKLEIPSIYGEIMVLDVTEANNGRFFLLTSVNSNEVYFYNLTTNSFAWFCSGKAPFSVKNIAFNPTYDSLFVTYGAEGIYVYESTKGQYLRKIVNPNNSNTNAYVNYTLRFSPNGKLIMADYNDSLRVFNFENGKLLGTYKGYLGFFVSDSNVFISGYFPKEQETRYWNENIYTKMKEYEFSLERLDYLTEEHTFDRARNLLYISKNSEIKMINVLSGQFVNRASGMPSEKVIAQFDPLNKSKLIVSIDKEIKTVDAITGKVDKVWKLKGDEINYNQDFSKIAITRSGDVFVYSTVEETLLYKVIDVDKVIFTGEGQLICFSYFNGIRILNEQTGQQIYSNGGIESKEILKSYVYVPIDKELILVLYKSLSHPDKMSYKERIAAMKKVTYLVGIDISAGKEKYKQDFPTEYTDMIYSSKGQLAIQTYYSQFKLVKDEKEIFIRSDLYVTSIRYSDDGNYFYLIGSEGQLECYDTETGLLIFINRFHDKKIEMMSWRDSLLLTVGRDGKSVLLNTKDGKLIGSYLFFKGEDHVMIDANNYYKGSKKGVEGIYFKKGSNYYPIEQFDAQQNRPDKVLKSFGEKDMEVIKSYENAVIKRLNKMGIKPSNGIIEFSLPQLTIKDAGQIPLISTTGQLTIELLGKSSSIPLKSMHIWINDVPIYGINGLTIGVEGLLSFEKKLRLELAEGNNKLQLALMNNEGLESEKLTYFIFYEPLKPIKKYLYLINLGVSHYADSLYDLSYASKDAKDLEALFQSATKTVYDSIIHYTLIDQELTSQNVLNLKKQLLKAGRNDAVIITFAGHGLLDNQYNYYLATYDIDFNQPAVKGLSYESFEQLLDGIAPLKKTLFIDACHSGEVEVETISTLKNTNVTAKKVGRGGESEYVGKTQELNTSELTKELFNDLRRGTGATVISASGGLDLAMEIAEYQNGLFTYCILHGLKDLAADKNEDGKIMLSELQMYLQEEVYKLSNGAQKPTSRIENLSLDYRIW